jgi:sortase A
MTVPTGRAKLSTVRGRDRAGLTVLQIVCATAAVVLAAVGCGSVKTLTAGQSLTSPPSLPVPSHIADLPAQPEPPTTTPTTTAPTAEVVPLPEPSFIPFESYASEPVVEIGTMEIPKIGLVHRIFHGVTLNNIDHGPSHWPGTAVPGQPGNTVFAGHRVTHSHPFRRIDELGSGDEVIFNIENVRSVYRVTGSMVVEPEAVWIADQTAEPTGTLYACHPPGSAAYRYVVKMALSSVSAV